MYIHEIIGAEKAMSLTSLKYFVLFVLVAFAGLITHESGHGLVACFFGGKVTRVTIGPGIQILPTISMVPWDGTFGSVSYSLPPEGLTIWERSTIGFMGAAATALLALVAAILAQVVEKGYLKNLLFIIALLWPLDILTYSIFPNLGLRHWILFGGVRSEPYESALGMGIAPVAFFTTLGLYAIGIYSFVTRGFFSNKERP